MGSAKNQPDAKIHDDHDHRREKELNEEQEQKVRSFQHDRRPDVGAQGLARPSRDDVEIDIEREGGEEGHDPQHDNQEFRPPCNRFVSHFQRGNLSMPFVRDGNQCERRCRKEQVCEHGNELAEKCAERPDVVVLLIDQAKWQVYAQQRDVRRRQVAEEEIVKAPCLVLCYHDPNHDAIPAQADHKNSRVQQEFDYLNGQNFLRYVTVNWAATIRR